MTLWLVLSLMLLVWGTVTRGVEGFLGAVAIALVVLPFWFITWIMFFYEPDDDHEYEQPDDCYTKGYC